MHIRLLAVGDRQPGWVDDATTQYATRFPREWRFRLDLLGTGRRGKQTSAQKAIDAEGQQLLDRVRPDEALVLLDERGKLLSSKSLARQLASWQSDGRDLAFVIGGPDGVSADVRARADFSWSLTPLTLPHGLARILFAEQLYRASTMLSGHPYHRE